MVAYLGALLAFLAGCVAPDPSALSDVSQVAQPGFVVRSGARFTVDGRPTQLVGATAELLQGRIAWEMIPRLLDGARDHGLTVLRVWAFSDGPAREPNDWERTFFFRMGPDRLNDGPYARLDEVVQRAGQNGIRLILVLGNHWPAYGGIMRYDEWFNGQPAAPNQAPDRASPTSAQSRFFYTDARAKQAYRTAAQALIERVNPLTGVAYRDDPAIMGWELMNEPRAQEAYVEAQYEWNREMAAFVRQEAPFQLISTGLDTGASPETVNADQWQRLGAIPQIDYVDLHLYPGQGLPRNPANPSQLDARLAAVSGIAHRVLGKPVILGELGYSPQAARAFTGSATADADDLLVEGLESALVRHEFDAAMFWLWSLDKNPARVLNVSPGDPTDARLLERISRLSRSLGSRASGL